MAQISWVWKHSCFSGTRASIWRDQGKVEGKLLVQSKFRTSKEPFEESLVRSWVFWKSKDIAPPTGHEICPVARKGWGSFGSRAKLPQRFMSQTVLVLMATGGLSSFSRGCSEPTEASCAQRTPGFWTLRGRNGKWCDLGLSCEEPNHWSKTVILKMCYTFRLKQSLCSGFPRPMECSGAQASVTFKLRVTPM